MHFEEDLALNDSRSLFISRMRLFNSLRSPNLKGEMALNATLPQPIIYNNLYKSRIWRKRIYFLFLSTLFSIMVWKVTMLMLEQEVERLVRAWERDFSSLSFLSLSLNICLSLLTLCPLDTRQDRTGRSGMYFTLLQAIVHGIWSSLVNIRSDAAFSRFYGASIE